MLPVGRREGRFLASLGMTGRRQSRRGSPRLSFFVLPALLLTVLLSGCSGSPQRVNNRGNQAYERQDYTQALADYQQAGSKLPQAAEPAYNAGNTLYRQGDYGQSQAQLQHALQQADGSLSQQGYYNLGNALFQVQQYGPAAEVFKEALHLDPADVDAKHNLELALQKQAEQQQQQQQQQQEQQQQSDEADNQESSSQDKPSGDGNQPPQEKPPEDSSQPSGEDKPSEQDNQGQEQQQSSAQNESSDEDNPAPQDQTQAQPGQRLTEEQARQLLAAAAANAESLQEYLQQVFMAPESPPAQDW